MTKNQIYNLYIFIVLMLQDKGIIANISPDYLEEKSLLFLNILGKNEFIQEPEIWKEYCDIWKIDKDNYEIMNIINFLFNIPNNQKKLLNIFEMYIGNIEKISKLELKHFAHKKLIEWIDDKGFIETRFMKLKILDYVV